MRSCDVASIAAVRTSWRKPMITQSAQYKVVNQTRSTVVCHEANLAAKTTDRLRGLLGRKELGVKSGLLIDPCSGVHTWGMAFPLDILALNRTNHVIGLWTGVGPGRIRGMSFKTRRVLEVAAGSLSRSGTCVGDQLVLEEYTHGPARMDRL